MQTGDFKSIHMYIALLRLSSADHEQDYSTGQSQ